MLRIFLPYFLPASTRHKSLDEGDVFRDSFRKNQKYTSYFILTNGIFYSIKKEIKKALNKNNIKVFTNSKLLIDNKKNLKIFKKDGKKFFMIKKTKIFLYFFCFLFKIFLN